ncbi:bile acid:sodium symporter [Streptomyces sp. CB02923]|uniref:bile acid:sodium symporter family protein n=1 Tax=Streptomyces sp. CB02923 TaxID=1718985 RepID=UPI0009694525|nr:bile acid:sodium symporter family protein [Streptomyces sp. CB02923]OKH98054.1 bile acid:sodium symporter [Streptomyces sp. CB02923]
MTRCRPDRLRRAVDPYVAALLGTVLLATLLPATGRGAVAAGTTADLAIGLLFFLYGARLSTREAVHGLRQWKLHLLTGASTFVLFPLLGLAAGGLVPFLLTDRLYTGLLFLCVVPSTVQSSIALTSTARGNVPAAICAGTYSSLVGMAATPLLAAWLIGSAPGFSAAGLLSIATHLLLPFLAGQSLRRWTGGFLTRHKKPLGLLDRASILLVVYTAFSKGMTQGIWQQVTPVRLLALLLLAAGLLATALVTTSLAARRLGFCREDRVTIVFCGSNKSLATGLPMAAVLFGGAAGPVILPLMLYHQLQLMVCAVIAARWSRRPETAAAAPEPPLRPVPRPVEGEPSA